MEGDIENGYFLILSSLDKTNILNLWKSIMIWKFKSNLQNKRKIKSLN